MYSRLAIVNSHVLNLNRLSNRRRFLSTRTNASWTMSSATSGRPDFFRMKAYSPSWWARIRAAIASSSPAFALRTSACSCGLVHWPRIVHTGPANQGCNGSTSVARLSPRSGLGRGATPQPGRTQPRPIRPRRINRATRQQPWPMPRTSYSGDADQPSAGPPLLSGRAHWRVFQAVPRGCWPTGRPRSLPRGLRRG